MFSIFGGMRRSGGFSVKLETQDWFDNRKKIESLLVLYNKHLASFEAI